MARLTLGHRIEGVMEVSVSWKADGSPGGISLLVFASPFYSPFMALAHRLVPPTFCMDVCTSVNLI